MGSKGLIGGYSILRRRWPTETSAMCCSFIVGVQEERNKCDAFSLYFCVILELLTFV